MPLLKTPASATAVACDRYATPRSQCAVCGHKLTVGHNVEATLMTLTGPTQVTHVAKRCGKKGCRVYHYHNFWQHGAEKTNCVEVHEARAIFVNAKQGFDLQFLRYHEALKFKCLYNANLQICIAPNLRI